MKTVSESLEALSAWVDGRDLRAFFIRYEEGEATVCAQHSPVDFVNIEAPTVAEALHKLCDALGI